MWGNGQHSKVEHLGLHPQVNVRYQVRHPSESPCPVRGKGEGLEGVGGKDVIIIFTVTECTETVA